MKFTRAQQVASFISKIEIKEPNDCWLWKGCVYGNGMKYGAFKWRGKMRGANRVAWEIANAQDCPDDMDVLHTCDNSMCVNPLHLRLGTHQDNMLDMHRKQRCTISTLTHDQVREVCGLLAAGMKGKDLAERYGVSRAVISDIKLGYTYKFVV